MNDFDGLSNELSLKIKEIDIDLKKVEKYIFDLESEYLNSTSSSGNIIRGWDHIFTSKPKMSNNNSQFILNANKKIKINSSERVFSSTSYGALEQDRKSNIELNYCNLRLTSKAKYG